MKKLNLFIMALACLLLTGCMSKTGRQNIQYIRPAEDSATYNDVVEEKPDTMVAEEEYVEMGLIPSEEDYERLRSKEVEKEIDRFLGY